MTRKIFLKKWGSDVDSSVAPTDTKIEKGFIEERPPFQWQNFVENRQDEMLDEISKNGIPNWIATETFPLNGLTLYLGIIYKSLQTGNTNKTPLSEPTWWTIDILQQSTTSLKGISFLSKYWIWGLEPISGSVPDEEVTIGIGKAICENGSTIVELTSAEVDLDLPTLNGGALANSTTYHLFRFLKDDDTMQWWLDTSLSPTITDIKSAGAFRRIGSFTTDGSGDLYEFKGSLQGGAIRYDPVNPVLLLTTGGAGYTGARANVPSLITPLGLKILATYSLSYENSSAANGNYGILTDLEMNDEPPTAILNTMGGHVAGSISDHGSGREIIHTDTSRNVGFRAGISTSGSFSIHLRDWTDFRNYY